MTETPRILGVRHHSPACARLVRRRILEDRPQRVLIEGPCDFNGQRQLLLLNHQLPIAIFSSLGGQHRSYIPFCDYSPEWVALQTAVQVGAEFFFIDLPTWHPDSRESGQQVQPGYRPMEWARQLGYDCQDALWDAMVEQSEETRLEENLSEYFRLLRLQVGDRDAQREEFMSRAVAWGASQGRCLVVCGGLHAPILEQRWPGLEPNWEWLVPPAEARSFLVPFSFQRLSSLEGYQAGMTCPEYYQRLWESDATNAGFECLGAAADELRRREQKVSTADLIAAWNQAEGLARLRGHRQPLRCDVLDGLLAALSKEALDELPPWSLDAPLRPASHPQLVALVRAFSGSRRGKLDPATPRPPLFGEVEQELQRLQLQLTRPPRRVETKSGSETSVFLWRLWLLQLPGVQLLSEEPESWSLGYHDDFEAGLLEASAYGANLVQAAAGLLEAGQTEWKGASDVARSLHLAVQAGLEQLSQRWLPQLSSRLAGENQLEELGPALQSLALTLKIHPQLDPQKQLLLAGVDRLLWLLEGQLGCPQSAVEAVRVLRDLLRLPELSVEPALEVMARLACSASSSLRGAALGLIWCFRGQPPELLKAMQGQTEPGEFLWGLFRLAREEVLGQEPLLRAIHEHLVGLDSQDFLRQLPGLRQAFQEFPPRQKEQLALLIAPWMGLGQARELTRPGWEPSLVQRAVRLDRILDEEMQRLGW